MVSDVGLRALCPARLQRLRTLNLAGASLQISDAGLIAQAPSCDALADSVENRH